MLAECMFIITTINEHTRNVNRAKLLTILSDNTLGCVKQADITLKYLFSTINIQKTHKKHVATLYGK